jgi:hypothetical protein
MRLAASGIEAGSRLLRSGWLRFFRRLFRATANRLALRFNARCPITAIGLRIHPLLKIIVAIPNQGTELPESWPSPLKPPPAQRRQADFLGNLKFGQRDPGHLGTSVGMGFAFDCEYVASPNMN